MNVETNYLEVTREKWKKTHKDYKSIIKGQKYMLVYDNGTCLKPVKIIK
jgi:hypothetical protein